VEPESDFVGVDVGKGVVISSINFGFGVAVAVGWALEWLGDKKEGMSTVRDESFPFEARLGVPISRDRSKCVCASTR
jgi:hypothetical protein